MHLFQRFSLARSEIKNSRETENAALDSSCFECKKIPCDMFDVKPSKSHRMTQSLNYLVIQKNK